MQASGRFFHRAGRGRGRARAGLVAAALGLLAAGCAGGLTREASPGFASPRVEAAVANAEVEAASGAYALDPAHTSVIWRVRHLGLAMYTGRFNTVSGALTFDAEAPERSSLEVEIAAASLDTGHAQIVPNSTFDREIAETALGAREHPAIRFVATAASRGAPNRGAVTGDLTFNGVTRPVTLEVTFYGARRQPLTGQSLLGFAARATIVRSEWGSTRWLPFVGDEVELVIETEFIKS